MKYKIGTDIEEIDRIEKAVLQNPAFLNRVYTENEIQYLNSRGKFIYSSAAGIFCAKEAFSKALGTGFVNFGLHDVEILHNSSGAPYINLKGKLSYLSGSDFSVSISHTNKYATATVISYSNESLPEKCEYILSASQMRKADLLTSERIMSSVKLMENAAAALFSVCNNIPGEKAVILCGKGNNGGDGICLASILKRSGKEVFVVFLNGENFSDDGKYYFDRLEKGVKTINFSEETETEIKEIISKSDFVVDCLFGTGFSGELPENAEKILSYINTYTVACDLPSGVFADNGKFAKGTHRADITVTFGEAKPCHYLYPAKEMCGKIIVADIGIPEDVVLKAGYTARVINTKAVRKFVPKRPENSNKGTFGTLCLACGSENMPGAALLALKGAMSSGVGLCVVESCEKVKEILSGQVPEAVYSASSKKENAVAVGCGLTKNKDAIKTQIEKNLPTLFDADALNVLADDLKILEFHTAPKIMTPHPLEMSRLTGKTVDEIENNRFETARCFARKYNTVLLLKGHHTVIATPEGDLWVSKYGNSGLSKGGSGDVLSGFISGLLASGFSAEGAAVCGVLCQGLTADFLKSEKGERGFSPSDVANLLGKFIPDNN